MFVQWVSFFKALKFVFLLTSDPEIVWRAKKKSVKPDIVADDGGIYIIRIYIYIYIILRFLC